MAADDFLYIEECHKIKLFSTQTHEEELWLHGLKFGPCTSSKLAATPCGEECETQ